MDLEPLWHQPVWLAIAAIMLIMAAALWLLTNHLRDEQDKKPVLVPQSGHPRTGPELTIELYEQARKAARHH